jgi:ech hydrogenase subunit D
MTQEQSLEVVPVTALVEKVRSLRDQGYRLVQIGSNRLPEQVEITYSFDLNSRLSNLRVILPSAEPRLPSISSVYGCVILYENEIHDLFNVKVEGMAVDFQGRLYQTTVKFPFGTVKAPAPKPAAAPAAARPAPAPAPASVPAPAAPAAAK